MPEKRKNLIYKINMTPFEFFNTIILLFIALMFFIGVMWFGGTLVGYGGLSYDTYYTKYKPMIIISESMTPTIEVNSLLFVENKPFEELSIGDIILFNTAEYGMVGHRIVASIGDGFKTKGDHNHKIDNWVVTESMYKGCVAEIHNEFAPFITLLFGDLDNLNLGKLFLGFVLLAIFLVLIILLLKWIYDFIFIYYFISKSSKNGGRFTVERYYPYIINSVQENQIAEVLEKLSNAENSSFFDRLKVRLHLLKFHRTLIEEEKSKRRYLYSLEKLRKDLK